MKKPLSKPAGTNRGFALVIVIVIVLLATFLASQLILQVRTELQVAHNIKLRGSGLFLAEAGINLGLFRLMDQPLVLDEENEEYQHFFHGHAYETVLPNGRVTYYAVNESGKIDLNVLQRGLLDLFLQYHNLEPDQIETILDSLQDWTDPDPLHRLFGAEKDYYETLTPPYTPRDKNIVEPSEFFLIKGTEMLAGKFDAAEIFTVHNNTRKINFNSLTPAMLDFLTEGDPDKKAAYYEAQALYINLNAAHAAEILGGERYAVLSPYLSFTSVNNSYYYIVSWGKKDYISEEENTPERHIAGMKVSVLAEVRGTLYTLLSWKADHS
jgi:type II secretory pathway component PulK